MSRSLSAWVHSNYHGFGQKILATAKNDPFRIGYVGDVFKGYRRFNCFLADWVAEHKKGQLSTESFSIGNY